VYLKGTSGPSGASEALQTGKEKNLPYHQRKGGGLTRRKLGENAEVNKSPMIR
jgi:hypothetical protein